MDKIKLPDTPWHISYIRKDEDDPRRHKSRCVYNNGKECNNAYMLEWIGSSHCKFYAETWDIARKFEREMEIKRISDAGIKINALKLVAENKKKKKVIIKHLSKNKLKKIGYRNLCTKDRELLISEIYRNKNRKDTFYEFKKKFEDYINNKPRTKENEFIYLEIENFLQVKFNLYRKIRIKTNDLFGICRNCKFFNKNSCEKNRPCGTSATISCIHFEKK